MSDYETLNLPENAPKELVERKYGALLRAYKQRTDEYGVTNADLAYYQRITEAYDRIVGTVHDYSDPNPTSIIPFKVRRVFYKLSANLEHYKFLLLGILMVTVLGLIAYFQFTSVEKHDLNIKFVGAFATTEHSNLTMELNEKSEVTRVPDITFFTVSEDTEYNGDSQDAALQFRMQFTSGAIDVVFIDKENFDVYKNEPVFLELSDFLELNKGKPGFDNLTLIEYESKGEQGNPPSGIYGIEFTELGSRYFEGTQLSWLNDYFDDQERSMILTICRRAQNLDRAQSYAAEIIQSLS